MAASSSKTRVVAWINGDPGQRVIHTVMLFVARWLPTHAFAVLVHRIVMRATSAGATQ